MFRCFLKFLLFFTHFFLCLYHVAAVSCFFSFWQEHFVSPSSLHSPILLLFCVFFTFCRLLSTAFQPIICAHLVSSCIHVSVQFNLLSVRLESIMHISLWAGKKEGLESVLRHADRSNKQSSFSLGVCIKVRRFQMNIQFSNIVSIFWKQIKWKNSNFFRSEHIIDSSGLISTTYAVKLCLCFSC